MSSSHVKFTTTTRIIFACSQNRFRVRVGGQHAPKGMQKSDLSPARKNKKPKKIKFQEKRENPRIGGAAAPGRHQILLVIVVGQGRRPTSLPCRRDACPPHQAVARASPPIRPPPAARRHAPLRESWEGRKGWEQDPAGEGGRHRIHAGRRGR